MILYFFNSFSVFFKNFSIVAPFMAIGFAADHATRRLPKILVRLIGWHAYSAKRKGMSLSQPAGLEELVSYCGGDFTGR